MMFTFAFFFLVYPACSSQFCRCWSAWPKSEVTKAQGRGERECLCPIVLAVLPRTRSFPKKTSDQIVYYYFIFSILGRRRFLLIGVSCMAVSVLTLGIVAHYTSLGHAERKCHFTPHSSPTISQVSSTTTNSTSFSFVSLSSVNTTNPTPALASKGLRYFTLSALVLFVGAYSFSFGPGELFYKPLITVNYATRLTIGE